MACPLRRGWKDESAKTEAVIHAADALKEHTATTAFQYGVELIVPIAKG